MTPEKYVEHLGQVIEALVGMFAGALEEELVNLIETRGMDKTLAAALFEGVRDRLMDMISEVDARINEHAKTLEEPKIILPDVETNAK